MNNFRYINHNKLKINAMHYNGTNGRQYTNYFVETHKTLIIYLSICDESDLRVLKIEINRNYLKRNLVKIIIVLRD